MPALAAEFSIPCNVALSCYDRRPQVATVLDLLVASRFCMLSQTPQISKPSLRLFAVLWRAIAKEIACTCTSSEDDDDDDPIGLQSLERTKQLERQEYQRLNITSQAQLNRRFALLD